MVEAFSKLGIKTDKTEICRFVDIGLFLEWLKIEGRGSRQFVVPLQEKDAIEYALLSGAPTINKSAWRLKVREYWSENDPDRFSALRANMLRAA